MINKVLLTGDTTEIVNKIHEHLNKYTQLPNLSFNTIGEISNLELKSYETLIYLKSKNKQNGHLQDLTKNKHIACITAIPDLTVKKNHTHTKYIATQRHLLYDNHNDSISLGDLKGNIPLSEPLIRESQVFLFDLNAIRSSELKNAAFAYPSGLFSEEATQMFRYAGMNEMNKVVIIDNCRENLALLISQFIWYYAEAAAIRFPDHPYFSNTVHEYVVNVDSLDLSISFYKSKTSGRWWVKIPDIPENKWKACSYADYQEACNDNISPDLLNVISAFG